MKPFRTPALSRGPQSFRDRKVTAPLKQLLLLLRSRYHHGFRDRKVTAPLKPVEWDGQELRVYTGFRDRKVTAPLKPNKLWVREAYVFQFP